MRRIMLLTLLMLSLLVCAAAEESEISFWDMVDVNAGDPILLPASTPTPETQVDEHPGETATAETTARDDLIDRIVETGRKLYEDAGGRARRASKKSDIYLCKNFTTHIFNEVRGDFCIAAFPDVQLRVPDNLPKEECKPYSYGFYWKDVAPEEGNPFYVAAQFRYDTNLSKAENLKLACEFMRQVQRGDYFQMSASYEHGVGAHSAIMLGYDAEEDEIHWMDSNMLGTRDKNRVRYGYVQFDAVKSVQWWAEAFCVRTRGATIYRLRDDIAYRED